jgi:hypothetical protein
MFQMPKPAADVKTKIVRDVGWKLFKADIPKVDDVEQGELHNCPLASLLAAMAYSARGKKQLPGIVKEHRGTVITDVSGVAKELDTVPAGQQITSTRFFTVLLAGKSIEVSSVLYTDDADQGWTPIYMRSPNSVVWPCVIEKAYAKKEGGYGELDTDYGKGLSLNEIWEVVTGSKPQVLAIDRKTKDAALQAIAKKAATVPVVAASKADARQVTISHGFAVLGMKGAKMELYDPMNVKRVTISLDVIRDDFVAIFYGRG